MGEGLRAGSAEAEAERGAYMVERAGGAGGGCGDVGRRFGRDALSPIA